MRARKTRKSSISVGVEFGITTLCNDNNDLHIDFPIKFKSTLQKSTYRNIDNLSKPASKTTHWRLGESFMSG